jgi:pyridoxal phosphate enzyme (YggS family)
VSLIQSVDSIKLANEIDRQALKHNKIMDILVEVNIGNEESKSGVMKNELADIMFKLSELKNIRVKGLMTIPPIGNSERYFCEMQELFENTKGKHIDNVNMELLSMGMSADYVLAVKYGSNIVRIGTALFGARK